MFPCRGVTIIVFFSLLIPFNPYLPTPADYIADPCTLPKEAGPCYNYEYRWYYNYAEDYCAEFVYGGCGGNANLFSSREECEMTCPQTAKFTTTTTTPAPTTEFTGGKFFWQHILKSSIHWTPLLTWH